VYFTESLGFFGPELPFKFLDKTAFFGQFKVGFKVGPILFGTNLSQNETPKVGSELWKIQNFGILSLKYQWFFLIPTSS